MSASIAESHKNRLGCSEIAAALGLSRWKTPYQLWLEKTGRATPEDLAGVLRVDLGNRLEQVVAQMYKERTGQRVFRNGSPMSDPAWPYLVGHLDRRIVGQRKGLEIKTHLTRFSDREWGEEGTDKIPSEYLLQVTGYLMVSGWKCWDVAVLMAGPEFKIYTVRRNEELVRFVGMGLDRFWSCVETSTPPAPITLDDAAARWPDSVDKPAFATPATRALISELREIKAKRDGLEVREHVLELQIKETMKDCAVLVDGDSNKTMATWKTQTSNRIDVKKLRAEFPEVSEACMVSNHNRVFRLKGASDE